MGLVLSYEYGQTKLDEDEKEGLKIKTITTHKELDEYEQLNIEKALEWTITKKLPVNKILSEDFIASVHKKMLGDVWKWAGEFRRTEKNIGVDWINIGIDLRILLDDPKWWIENETFPPDELAIRFKHRLVSIHCFPNGNGRHARLMADLIIEMYYGQQPFSWGMTSLVKPSETRQKYIEALREADRGNIHPLRKFARS